MSTEEVSVASKRQVKENDLIDEFLRAKLSDLLNFRSELMQQERKKNPGQSVKQLQRKVRKSLVLKDKVKDLEQQWFMFCQKPVRKGLLSAKAWKKVVPNRTSFRLNANDLLMNFDKQEIQMFKDQGAININPVWYKRIGIFIVNLFRKNGNK